MPQPHRGRVRKTTGVFRSIGHQHDVRMPIAFQCVPQRANASVHHVRRANDIRTASACDRPVSPMPRPFHHLDFAINHKTIVSIDIIGVQRHICHDRDIRNRRLDRAGCRVGQVVWVPCLGAVFGFLGRIGVGNRQIAGMPKSAASFAASTNLSTLRRTTRH